MLLPSVKSLGPGIYRAWFAFCLLLPPVSPLIAEELQPVDLQLRWHHQFQFAGYYAAKAQGYYREAGFEVAIHAGQPGREPVNEVLAGRAQFGVANGELLHQRLMGKPLVALAAIFQHSASVLIAKQTSGIRSPHDLVGRKVMLISAGADVSLVAMLHKEGVDLSRVEVMKSSYNIDDLVADRVDAFNSYLTNEPFYLEQKGIPFAVIHPATYGVDFYSDILFTTEKLQRQSPDSVRRFREASLRGWQYAMEHSDEMVELILRDYSQAKSREHLRFEAERMRSLILPRLVELGHMNPGRWRHMADTFVAQGMAAPGFDLQGFVYDPHPGADLVHWRQGVVWLGGGLALIVTVLVLLVLYNRKLRNAISYGQMVQAKLRNQTALFEAIFRSTPDATLITDRRRELILCNPAFSQIFGYRPEEVLGRSSEIIFESAEQFAEQGLLRFHADAKTRLVPFEQNYRRKSGELFPGHSMGGPIVDRHGETLGYILVVRDITEQKRSEQAIVRMALTDSLTGLGNRHHFNQRVDELVKLAKRRATRFSLLLMDLDHFKAVNDQHGHPLGDELLCRVGLVLRGVFRETDVIARIGGDEFAVIMVDQDDPAAIRQPAERVIAKLSRPMDLDGYPIEIGASIGVAIFPLDTDNPTELYRLADKALYYAKQNGRNLCALYRDVAPELTALGQP